MNAADEEFIFYRKLIYPVAYPERKSDAVLLKYVEHGKALCLILLIIGAKCIGVAGLNRNVELLQP